MVARLGALLLVALMLSGCATASNCAGWSQINPSRNDVLTDGTEAQILKHNIQGSRQGCWKPNRRKSAS